MRARGRTTIATAQVAALRRRRGVVLRAIRDFYVLNAAPERVGLQGAGWRVGLVCNGTAAVAWLHRRYSDSAVTIESSR
jgi:hypothetical protein